MGGGIANINLGPVYGTSLSHQPTRGSTRPQAHYSRRVAGRRRPHQPARQMPRSTGSSGPGSVTSRDGPAGAEAFRAGLLVVCSAASVHRGRGAADDSSGLFGPTRQCSAGRYPVAWSASTAGRVC